jgi:hypothetical protein
MMVVAGVAQSGHTQTATRFTRRTFSRLSVQTRAANFEQTIMNAARQEEVDPNVIWVIAYNETRFRPWLVSSKGAQGLMQFLPSTAARFGLRDPFDSKAAIEAAARYVSYLSKMFGGRLDSILAAYNAGEGTVLAYMCGRPFRIGSKTINAAGTKTIGGIPPYIETTTYVGRGLKVYRWLESRRAFPLSAAHTGLPDFISPAIAGISLVDPELGLKQSFAAPRDIGRGGIPTSGSPRQAPLREPQKNIGTDSPKNIEIFYDPRSGNRFLLRRGKRSVRLPDSGPVVVSADIRTGVESHARTTFFASADPASLIPQ